MEELKAFTFDDISLVPAYSEILPSEIKILHEINIYDFLNVFYLRESQ